ncbi:hypothetical protein BVY01_02720 [bacterium I07]|nr:hypothetical protein BVY01_02720 [bacterium I07]
MPKLERAIQSIFKDCFRARSNENIFILADAVHQSMASQFFTVARQISNHSLMTVLPAIRTAGTEPPPHVAGLMKHADVMLILTSKSISHTQARRQACKHGARIASLPGITEDILTRTITGQYKQMVDKSRKIADILTIGRNVQLSSAAGTSLTCSIAKMQGYADTGMLHQPGRFSNLPAGEGSTAPIPKSANGVLVIDGSFPIIGKMVNPVRISFKNGRAIRISGGDEAVQIRKMLRPFGQAGRLIAELGIGTNPDARFTGCVLEDEKSIGTVHVAMGNNISFGGNNSVRCHYDAVILKPTLIIDNKNILEEGRLQV